MFDWDRENWGATGVIRYISAVEETQAANTLDAVTYLDAQLRWRPGFVSDRFALTAGINNLTDEDPPGCESCGLNNYDPNAYDAPGRFYYLRLSYRPWP
jgi:iron complex outermembrane receptor protein